MSISKLINDEFKKLITDGFCELLETKHLYQNISIDVSSLSKLIDKESKTNRRIEVCFISAYANLLKMKWAIWTEGNVEFPILLPTIKIYCNTCKRIEPYNPSLNTISKKQVVLNYPDEKAKGITHQLFVIEYICQSCKGLPVVFMIRRKGLKIYLVGRFPIEATPIPNFIPRAQSKYFSDAKIAHNSGQTLAGLFFLRVFIEQYTKDLSTDKKLPADRLIENYMKQLPKGFKSKFPSLSKIYSKLSDAIHKADASVKLFDKSIEEIVEHFDAKRLHKISDSVHDK